jgi:hypothetical protein
VPERTSTVQFGARESFSSERIMSTPDIRSLSAPQLLALRGEIEKQLLSHT